METVGTINEREETVIEWLIADFSSLSEEHGISYFSPLFYFHKESWCIELCPNGRKEDSSNMRMHVYLRRKTSGPPLEIEWCFGMKGSKGYRTSVFINRKHNSSILWITRDDILEKKSEYLSSDTFALLCFIRHSQCIGFSDNLLQTNSESSIQFPSKSNLASSDLETVGTISQREDLVIEWSIKDFLSFGEGVSYCSPFFSFENICWYMEVFAESEKRETDEFIPVYLRKKSSGPPIKIEYTFGYHGYFYVYTDYLTRGFNELECNDDAQGLYTFLVKKSLLSLYPLTLVCRIKQPQFTEYSEEACLKSSKNIREYTVLQDLKQLFLKQKDCDVVLKVRGQEFSAHRNILAARSPVFESTFRNDMKEKETGIVNIEDCDPSSFSDFLCFLYCGEIETLSEENVFGLFTSADKYDVQDLRKICLEFMKENISVNTFCDTISLALQHSETELIKLATDFFTKNSLKIVKTLAWQNFAAENPTQSNELVIKGFEAAARVIS